MSSLSAYKARVESRFSEALGACGLWPSVLVALGGLSMGLLIWWEEVVRVRETGGFLLDLGLVAALTIGVLIAFPTWYLYATNFAKRCGIKVETALRWNAPAWAMLTVIPLAFVQPWWVIGMGHSIALGVSLWALTKLLVAARFNQTVREVTVTFVVTRIPIIAIAELAYVIIGQRAGQHVSESNIPLLAVWGRWDAVHYIDIARTGYYGTDMAFFPLYPLLIHLLTAFTDNALVAGLLISNISFFFGLLFCYKLVEHQYNRGVAYRTIFYISIFPTAVFFSAVYTESLFFALTVASFYYIREHRWLAAGLFGALASATRVEGILLVVPYALEYLTTRTEMLRHILPWAWWRGISDEPRSSNVFALPPLRFVAGGLLIPVGMAIYMAYSWMLKGDPIYFTHVQSHWDRKLAWPWVSVIHAVKSIIKGPPVTTATQCIELGFTVLMVAVLLAGLPRLRLSYWSYMALSIVVPMSTSSLMSMPRFALVLFPMFVILGLWGGRPALNSAIVALSLPLLGLFTVLFANWYWVA